MHVFNINLTHFILAKRKCILTAVLQKYKEMDFTQTFRVNLTHFVLPKHKCILTAMIT